MRIRVLYATFASLIATLPLADPAGAEAQDTMRLSVDHARVLKIERPAETIIVGNPSIMDVAVHDARTLILTGRSYGVTNLVVLDADGRPVLDEQVAVGSDETASVRIFRQAHRTTYSCTPNCEPTVSVGDESAAFDGAAQQFTTRETLARGTGQ